jgi:hypothetical protein
MRPRGRVARTAEAIRASVPPSSAMPRVEAAASGSSPLAADHRDPRLPLGAVGRIDDEERHLHEPAEHRRVRAPHTHQHGETRPVGEVEEGREPRRLALVGHDFARRDRGRGAAKVRHTPAHRVLRVADRTAERAVHDMPELGAGRRGHEPALLMRDGTAQRIHELDEHAPESSGRACSAVREP